MFGKPSLVLALITASRSNKRESKNLIFIRSPYKKALRLISFLCVAKNQITNSLDKLVGIRCIYSIFLGKHERDKGALLF